MKNYILACLTLLVLFGCATDRFLPNEVDKRIEFGMSKESFLKFKKDDVSKENDGFDFRHVYIEYLKNSPVEFLVYYFDADNNEPLYEIILNYKDEKVRDEAAKSLFGEPNHENNTEWMLPQKNGPTIAAWTFKNKLVIVAQIAETEWHLDENK
ncbi:MAG: hypothetical protein ACPG21_06315 [Crocinitomicaceae bacterium]